MRAFLEHTARLRAGVVLWILCAGLAGGIVLVAGGCNAGQPGGATIEAAARELTSSDLPVDVTGPAPDPIATAIPTDDPMLTPTEELAPTGTPAVTSPPPVSPPPMPTPINAPRDSRYIPTPLVPDNELAADVVQRIAGLSGQVGVAIKELDTGRGTSIDPDGEYEAASLYKLPVMYEVFKQRELGALAFDESLVFTQRYVDWDLGTLDRPVDSTITIDEALEQMITISDNSSAVLLTDRVGALNINRDLLGLGLAHTRLVTDDLAMSPGDALTLLEMIARGHAVNPAASAEMVDVMARQRVNDRLPLLLPDSTVVAHKTGNLPGVVNDVGIVYTPETTFIIAVLIDGTANEQAAAEAIADLALIAYRHFRSA
ncbi:MAG: hypothetical protein GEU73_15745 [Chloroflexi bacterium]|nr:hypothetical protein [Chloroflexota bacterium]